MFTKAKKMVESGVDKKESKGWLAKSALQIKSHQSLTGQLVRLGSKNTKKKSANGQVFHVFYSFLLVSTNFKSKFCCRWENNGV
jgi:hypothetical protein